MQQFALDVLFHTVDRDVQPVVGHETVVEVVPVRHPRQFEPLDDVADLEGQVKSDPLGLGRQVHPAGVGLAEGRLRRFLGVGDPQPVGGEHDLIAPGDQQRRQDRHRRVARQDLGAVEGPEITAVMPVADLAPGLYVLELLAEQDGDVLARGSDLFRVARSPFDDGGAQE